MVNLMLQCQDEEENYWFFVGKIEIQIDEEEVCKTCIMYSEPVVCTKMKVSNHQHLPWLVHRSTL